jgi:DNA polymerase I-like protein with 3'-5' exonuclease and polymerase domains/uracil-DNA glycosylase
MIRPSGPCPAPIMIVGEAPGEREMLTGQPFMGVSGEEMNRMLHEAGIMRSQCFVTNVARERPAGNDISLWVDDHKRCPGPAFVRHRDRWVQAPILNGIDILKKEIELCQPKVIIAFGNVALWALTGKWGIKSWRGSALEQDLVSIPVTVIPAYHPAAILRDWSMRACTVQDLRRAAKWVNGTEPKRPEYEFLVRPSFDAACQSLEGLLKIAEYGPLKLSVDIETRRGHIACIGFAWSATQAICIPLMCVENKEGYWLEEEETQIVQLMVRLLQHPNCRIVGQNFLYDAQYIYRHWHVIPNYARDTMLSHHSLFPGTPKGLDYLSSLYCDYHVYWKDEGKEWNTSIPEEEYWSYNCKDAVITYEIDEVLQSTADSMGMRKVFDAQNQSFWRTFKAMNRGLRRDEVSRQKMALELSDALATREQYLLDVLGHPLNIRSPKQMKEFFYDDLRQKVVLNRKTKQPSLDDDALDTIARREPLLRPLIQRIREMRSIGVFLSTFVMARPDNDGRIRSSFNPAGTETFRYSSSTNAFGSGLNLQNIPKGDEEPEPGTMALPNIRKLFVPDPGYTFFDIDLDRADLQVVVWEADDEQLRLALQEGIDLHLLNAGAVFGIAALTLSNLRDPNFVLDAKSRFARQRQFAKAWVHGTNYGGGPRTMAAAVGVTIVEAERYRARWFHEHPGIAAWHDRTEKSLRSTRSVTNKLGYRRHYFDRVDGLLPEALAWVPQSTVACVINQAWQNIYEQEPQIEVLLQVHDSLGGQYRTHLGQWAKDRICTLAQVTIPYEKPLTIPVGIKTSTISWGDAV